MTAPDLNSCQDDSVRGLPPAADAAVRTIDRACRMLIDGRRAARALGEWTRRFELSEPEFQVLWCLRDVPADGVDQTTLAQWLALSPAQVSATVERLCAQGWIAQHVRPGDRRRHLWRLSADGHNLLITMLSHAGILRIERQDPDAPAAANANGREAAA